MYSEWDLDKIHYQPQIAVLLLQPVSQMCNIAVKFEITSALPKKVAVFWNVTPCRSVYRHQLFGEVCCTHQKVVREECLPLDYLKVIVANLSRILVPMCQFMWHHISELCTYVPFYVASYLRTLYLCASFCGVIAQNSGIYSSAVQICGLQTLGDHTRSFKTLQTWLF